MPEEAVSGQQSALSFCGAGLSVLAEATGSAAEVSDLGRMRYASAFALQSQMVQRRKQSEVPDQILFLEHPHVVTLGRNARSENLLASPELLERAGIELHHTDRGGDVTYHGPGQIVCYPIIDLRDWKRDVVAYVRALEQVLIEALAEFDIQAGRETGATGVWTSHAKIAAIGVHISRWVTSHGFALNLDTDLSYFRYIVPCGLTKPVTSMRALGCHASRTEVIDALTRAFSRVFERRILMSDRAQRNAAASFTSASDDAAASCALIREQA